MVGEGVAGVAWPGEDGVDELGEEGVAAGVEEGGGVGAAVGAGVGTGGGGVAGAAGPVGMATPVPFLSGKAESTVRDPECALSWLPEEEEDVLATV